MNDNEALCDMYLLRHRVMRENATVLEPYIGRLTRLVIEYVKMNYV